jgi:hypothetical protein
VLRDAMFPRAVYRQTWERLSGRLSEREACKAIVGLLALAADGHEAQLATELENGSVVAGEIAGPEGLVGDLALGRAGAFSERGRTVMRPRPGR